ncbi:MAG: hypothetical protein K2G32_06230, partial [Oscillospiraceae bacterium]|nr:hypothetical protein [Oscillospiraceae bacterium]
KQKTDYDLNDRLVGSEMFTRDRNWIALGLGFVISAVVGFAAIKLVSWLLKKNRFKIFGVYTLVIGLLCVGFGLWEHISGETLFSMLNA